MNKTIMYMGISLLASVGIMTQAFGGEDGKALFGRIKSNQYVVTNEVDSVFTNWKNGQTVKFPNVAINGFYIGNNTLSHYISQAISGLIYSESDPLFSAWIATNDVLTSKSEPLFTTFTNGNEIAIGNGADAGNLSVAIGGYLKAGTKTWPGGPDAWSSSFVGSTYAKDRSVAIGDAAKADESVSVAIGNQAIVHSLHGKSGETYTYTNKVLRITESFSLPNVTTTNEEYAVYTVDKGIYERLPIPTGNMALKSDTHTEIGRVRVYEETNDAIYDMSYMNDEEMEYYNRIISSGQGLVPLTNALYGVAVGSRAYVFGYHGTAYGHYAHVSRPWGMAIGSESHVYSEGSHGFGYDTDIATNSPYSLAIGNSARIDTGLTNAIVIGVPQPKPDLNTPYNRIVNPPKAIRSNTINMVCQGNGLEDFYIDNRSIPDRMVSEIQVIGSCENQKFAKVDEVASNVVSICGIQNKDSVVLYSTYDIELFTDEYDHNLTTNLYGDASRVKINGMPLPQVIAKYSTSTTPTDNQQFIDYTNKVSIAAKAALESVNNANSQADMKAALVDFFNAIK